MVGQLRSTHLRYGFQQNGGTNVQLVTQSTYSLHLICNFRYQIKSKSQDGIEIISYSCVCQTLEIRKEKAEAVQVGVSRLVSKPYCQPTTDFVPELPAGFECILSSNRLRKIHQLFNLARIPLFTSRE
jgi:hypothetical protein